MQLSYTMWDKDGKPLQVWDERKNSFEVSYYVGPFESIEECKKYCDEYTEATLYGYNGRARLSYIDEKHYAYCSRWTSCD